MNTFCALNIDVIKTKFEQKLQHNLLHQLILHIVDAIIIWVAMSWWIIRSYPYPKNSGISEVVTIFQYIEKQTAILLLAMELTLVQFLYILKVILVDLLIIFNIPICCSFASTTLSDSESVLKGIYWWVS